MTNVEKQALQRLIPIFIHLVGILILLSIIVDGVDSPIGDEMDVPRPGDHEIVELNR